MKEPENARNRITFFLPILSESFPMIGENIKVLIAAIPRAKPISE
jgi:hypothetical protein